MATINPSPTPTPDKSQQNFKIGAIIAIAVLAILCAVLVFNLVSKNNENEVVTSELNESEQLKAELEKQYYEALSELEELRGSNEELNALIETQKTELKESKDRISALLRDSGKLKQARAEMKTMTAQVEQYLAEINQLREENQELTIRTVQLTEENTSLTTNLDSARMRNMALSDDKAILTSEKAELEAERSRLAKKVNIASVVKVSNLEVDGLKMRSSGKAVSRNAAKNIDQLQVCFQTSANQVAEPGIEQFLVRIINPLGETLAIEELGSGVFTNGATGEQIRYTSAKETDYDQDQQNLCINWAPNQPFQSGNYKVEVYNKGYMAGAAGFRLK